jgi:hypothetical protein
VNWRLFWIALTGVVLLGVDGFLLYNEQITPADAMTKAESRAQDPMIDMKYTASAREGNFARMGFSPEEVSTIVATVKSYEQRWAVTDPERDLVSVRIEATSDVDALITAFCGTGSTLPVRYAAMPFLLDDQGGQLKTVDFEAVSALPMNDWGKEARLQAVYEKLELVEDRKEDATRMGLAGVLARAEQAVLDEEAPWGRGLFAGWSWDGVVKKYPGVQQRTLNYAAILHLVLEVAHREGGICAAG